MLFSSKSNKVEIDYMIFIVQGSSELEPPYAMSAVQVRWQSLLERYQGLLRPGLGLELAQLGLLDAFF